MPLKFMRPYKLVVASDNYVRPTVAIGPRPAKRDDGDGTTRECIEFLTIGENGHTIFGEPEDLEEGVVQIIDKQRVGDDGQPVIWHFIPFTLALWTEMGEGGAISGYEKLKSQIQDEGTLINFYLANFLDDYWTEDYKAPPA